MAQNSSSKFQGKRPEKVFRIGSVSGSVFANDIETENGSRTIRSINLQRRYRDGDESKYSSSFGLSEIPQAITVLQMAQREFENEEAELVLD